MATKKPVPAKKAVKKTATKKVAKKPVPAKKAAAPKKPRKPKEPVVQNVQTVEVVEVPDTDLLIADPVPVAAIDKDVILYDNNVVTKYLEGVNETSQFRDPPKKTWLSRLFDWLRC